MKRLVLLPGILAMTLLASCSTSTSSGSESAYLTLSITDAGAAGLQSFQIDLTRISLATVDGDNVPIFAGRHRVDLADLAQTSQVLAIANVFPALFDKLLLTVDFSSVEAVLEGQQDPAALLDGDGNPLLGLTPLTIDVAIPIAAAIGENHAIEIDFGSEYALTLDQTNNAVTVEPAPRLRIDRSDAKPLLMYGVLRSVDDVGALVEADLTAPTGEVLQSTILTVETDAVLQIDGDLSIGVEGLALLKAVPAGTPFQAYGVVDSGRSRMRATHLEVGAGTRRGALDSVQGVILERTGAAGEDAILTIRGHSRLAGDNQPLLSGTFTVTTGSAATRVVRRGSADAWTTDALTIGQSVQIYGELAGNVLNASDPAGIATVLPSRVEGHLVTILPFSDTLTMELATVSGIDASEFNWAEAGVTPPDPEAFKLLVNVFTFSMGLVPGDRVGAIGTFRPMDDEAQDFSVDRLLRSQRFSTLTLRDRTDGLLVTTTVDPGSSLPPPNAQGLLTLEFVGPLAENERLQLDFGIAGTQDVALDLPLKIALLKIPTQEDDPLFLIAPEEKARSFAVTRRRSSTSYVYREYAPEDPFRQEYTQFRDFADRLSLELALGAQIRDLHVVGEYQSEQNRIDALLINAVVD